MFRASLILALPDPSINTQATTKRAPLFEDYENQWLSVKTAQLKPTSAARLKGIVQNHLVPGLGQLRLDEIVPSKIMALYAKKTVTGISGSTLIKIHDSIRQILVQAEGDRLIQGNPMAWVKRPKYEESEMAFYTKDQLQHLLNTAADHYPLFWPFVVIAAQTGMRQGEILKLTWGQVDFENNLILVRQAISEVGGKQKVGTIKTGKKGRRDLPMMSLTWKALHFQLDTLISRDLPTASDSYVFPCNRGKTTSPVLGKSTIIDRWKALVKKAELPYIKFHGLRHSHGTLLADEGMPVKNIMARLGHKTIAMANRYTHAIGETEVLIIKEMDRKWTEANVELRHPHES